MTQEQEPDQHEQTADALKAIADGTHKGSQGSADGFVGPDEPEESEEEEKVEPVDGVTPEPAEGLPAEPDSTGYDLLPDPEGADALPAGQPSGLGSRRRRLAELDQRERQAHAHQYKTVMIPLLITMGVILLLMGTWSVIRASGAEGGVAGEGIAKWFPILAFPLGAVLLAGAWWFHQDVTRKRK